MILSLSFAGGACWIFAFYQMIRLGIRDKTYGIPLFALGLNVTWELIYSIEGIFLIQVQTIIGIAWFILNLVNTYLYFKYGRERFPQYLQKKFVPLSIAAFLFCLGVQAAFYFQFDIRPASQYSVFLQNVLTSLLFIYMFYSRGDMRGQSPSIAVSKLLGSLIYVIQKGYVEMINPYIIICGALSFSADIYYIILLAAARHNQKKMMVR
ncbi:MAG: hypothetical protein M0P01_02810 [Treponema sp.]|nr:hypothetical protein [Treponema sp.]